MPRPGDRLRIVTTPPRPRPLEDRVAAAQGDPPAAPDTATAPVASLEAALADLRLALLDTLSPLLLPLLRGIDYAARRLPSWVTGGDER